MKITPKKILAGFGAAMAMTIGAVVMLTDSSIQSQINAANCGDVITLEAGKTYVENITLPVKPCTDTSYITIQSSRASELPEGKRITTAQAPLLAWLQSNVNAEPVIKTAPGAHHYKFIGVRVSTANEGVFVYDLVRWGGGKDTQKTLAEVPHHLVLDRSYVHGWPTQDVLRGVAANCGECSVINSHIDDIHWVGLEAQAIDAWNGPGPFHFNNNFLAGAGQSIMIGGADSASLELMPANGEIRRNHMFIPLSWKVGDPSYAGKHWTVKNRLEFKVGINWVVDGNVIENVWVDAQDGSIVLFTVRNQECTAPWSTIENITFTNNTVLNAQGAALNFLGMDNEVTAEFGKCNRPSTSGQGARVVVRNNVFDKIRGSFLQMNGFNDVTIENNTHLQGGNTMLFFGKAQSQRFIYRNNVTQEREYGIRDEGGTEGVAALEKMTPGYIFESNTMATPYTRNPPNNNYVPSLTIGSDYRTPYTGDGAEMDKLLAAQAGVVTPPLPSPSPSIQPSVSPQPSATQPLPPASPTPTQAPPSPSPTSTPTPRPSPSPSPAPVPCLTTAWPNSVSGQNAKMQERRTQGCYPVRRTNNGMEYARP